MSSGGHGMSRRGFLRTAAGAAVVGGVGLAGAGGLAGCGGDDATSPGRIRFHGEHQQGITTPAQRHAIVAVFDSTAPTRAALADALRGLSSVSAMLTAGELGDERGPLFPPTDSMIVDTTLPPDDLTVTIGFGASLFDDRYGLAGRKPIRLRPMDHFPNDQIDRARADGDICVQICAQTPEGTNHALRRLMRETRATLTLRWMLAGFAAPNLLGAGRSSMRNLLGFKDGTANPDPLAGRLMDELVWVQPGDDPARWTVGGTYGVIRIIRNRVEFWDRTSLRAQENIFGRHKASGAPLGMANETDEPDYAADPRGAVIPTNAHIRRANPRDETAMRTRILRRGFNYSETFTTDGQLDQGLLFIAFQRDLDAGFVAIQRRLDGEPLEEYITPVGGGYFFMPPGARDRDDWVGRTLFEV